MKTYLNDTEKRTKRETGDGVSRQDLNPGDLNSTAAEELDAPYSQGVTTEQFGPGCGLCSQAQLMGCRPELGAR